MSATLTVYSIASPRCCAIAAGATRKLRDEARHQISVRMSVLLEQSGRVERRRDRFRPMASDVSALSSIVANGHQVMRRFLHPLLSFRTAVFASTVGSQPRRPAPFRNRPRLRLTQSLRSFPFLAQGPGVSNQAVPTGPW